VKLDSLIAQLQALKAMYGPDVEVAFKAASEKNTPITSATFCFQEETRDWIISLASEVEEDECDYSGEWEENDHERRMEGWMDSRGEE
jgi:hypothetical protein